MLALPLVVAGFFPVLQAQAASIRAAQLRCEYRVNPLGIDVTQPRLSWVLEAANPAARGLKQSAYRVLAAASEQALSAGTGDLWDSGKVDSDQSTQVVYDGKSVGSGIRAFWKVEVWDESGKSSGWSQPALWSMGLLKPEDWKGKWIGRDEAGLYKRPGSPFHSIEKAQWIWFSSGDPGSGAPAGDRYFRAPFTMPDGSRVDKAVCVMGADSEFEVFVNGVHAGKGSNVHSPEIIEVTSQVKSGRNVVAVRAARRGAGKPAGLIGAIRVDFAKGEPFVFGTSGKWKSAESAPSGWEKAGFDDSGWSAAKELGLLGMPPWGEVGFSEERALPARLLRKEFEAPRKPKRATAYVSGLGLFELYVNGSKIGDQVLSPGLTDYDKRVQYVTFDVTPQLATGRNAIGLMLGNGRYHAPRAGIPIGSRDFGDPKALLVLNIEYEDGSTAEVVTDDMWKLTTAGPIRGNNDYDGRRVRRPHGVEWVEPPWLRRFPLAGATTDLAACRQDGGANGRTLAGGRNHSAHRLQAAPSRRLHLRYGPEHGGLVPPEGVRPQGNSGDATPCRNAA